MKKVTIKKLMLGSCFFASSMIVAFAGDPVVPVFERVVAPVPDQAATGDRDNQEAPEFGEKQFYHVRNAHAAFGDYNNDGFLDLFYSGKNDHISYWDEKNCFYENLGNGTFKSVFSPNMKEDAPLRGAHWSCPMWFDFNNDGYLDMLIGGVNWGGYKDSFSRLYQNMGPNEDGEFIFEGVPNAGGIRRFMNESDGGKSHQFIAVGDYDKDGYIDVVVAGIGWVKEDEDKDKEDETVRTERMVRLYKNNKGNGFVEIENPLDGIEPLKGLSGGSVHFVDIDKDGWLDIVSTGYGSGPEAYVYWNNGDGTFSKEDGQEFQGTYNSGSGVFDMNNDGYMDIVISGESPKTMFVYKNNGDRTFEFVSKEQAGFRGHDGGQFAFGDVNNDGWVDIFVGGHFENGYDQTSMLYLNKGDDTFLEVSNAVTNVSHGSQNILDFDNDGRLDLFVLGWTNSANKDSRDCATELWKNVLDNAVNQAPSKPSNLAYTYDRENKVITFTWDAAIDDNTPAVALRYNIFFKSSKKSNDVFMTVPADITTGFVKVGEISGSIMTNSYSMNCDLDEDTYTYEWGVQAIDNGNRGGEFAKTSFGKGTSSLGALNAINAIVYVSDKNLCCEVDGKAEIRVIDLSGKLVVKTMIENKETISGLTKGFYVVSISTSKGTKNISVVI